jgi:hypothetical protein
MFVFADLDHALEQQDLDAAVRLAVEYARKHGRPIPLDRAAQLLPMILRQSPGEYQGYALRFLERWVAERGRSIDEAVDVAVELAELPEAPDAQAAALTAGRIVRLAAR